MNITNLRKNMLIRDGLMLLQITEVTNDEVTATVLMTGNQPARAPSTFHYNPKGVQAFINPPTDKQIDDLDKAWLALQPKIVPRSHPDDTIQPGDPVSWERNGVRVQGLLWGKRRQYYIVTTLKGRRAAIRASQITKEEWLVD